MTPKQQARFLIKFAIDKDGMLDNTRVNEILAYVDKNFAPAKSLPILREFKHLAQNISFQTSSDIEFSGKLSDANLIQIKKFISENTQKKFNFSENENKELIAGIRVRAGDLIWENSLLQKFSRINK